MELHQLRYFCAVAHAGSFTRAAEQERISQPSLSQQIRKLETELGVPLCERLGRGTRLTPYSEALFAEATSILKNVAGAHAAVAALQDGVRGGLRVGAIPTVLPFFLAPRLSEFRDLYPEIEIMLSEDMTRGLVDRLQSGELDLAVAALPIKNPDIVCSELFREPLMVAVGRSHRLASADSVDLADVRHERMLLLKDGHCFRHNVLTACTRANIEFHSIFRKRSVCEHLSPGRLGLRSESGPRDGLRARDQLQDSAVGQAGGAPDRLRAGAPSFPEQAPAGVYSVAAGSGGAS